MRGTSYAVTDQRAIHNRIAKLGSVARLIEWFDRHYDAGKAG